MTEEFVKKCTDDLWNTYHTVVNNLDSNNTKSTENSIVNLESVILKAKLYLSNKYITALSMNLVEIECNKLIKKLNDIDFIKRIKV